MMGGAALLGAAGLVGLSTVETQASFFAAWGVIGVAMAGCLYEPCFAMVTRARGGAAKSGIIGITLAAGFASTISFPAMHGLAEAMGWRTSTLGFAAVAAFVAAPLLWRGATLLEAAHTVETHAGEETEIRRAFLRRPSFWLLASGFTLAAVVHGAVLHHLLPILDDRGVAEDAAIVAASFIGPMQVAGRLAMMAAGDRTTSHTFAIAAFLMMGFSVICLWAAGAAPALVVAFVVTFGGAYGTVSILRPVIAREVLGGNNFGAKSGALALPYLVGSASAPYLGALLWSAGGYDTVLVVLLGFAAGGAGLYVAARRAAHRS